MIALLHRIAIAATDVAGPTLLSEAPTSWDNLRLIITKPDNIPIILMIILVSFYTGLALRDARKHDRLIAEGRKNEILRTMQE